MWFSLSFSLLTPIFELPLINENIFVVTITCSATHNVKNLYTCCLRLQRTQASESELKANTNSPLQESNITVCGVQSQWFWPTPLDTTFYFAPLSKHKIKTTYWLLQHCSKPNLQSSSSSFVKFSHRVLQKTLCCYTCDAIFQPQD